MAAYVHVSRHVLSLMRDNPSEGVLKDVILCVGDGSTPRSAALFALFFPGWECFSVDPQLQDVPKRCGSEHLGIHSNTCK